MRRRIWSSTFPHWVSHSLVIRAPDSVRLPVNCFDVDKQKPVPKIYLWFRSFLYAMISLIETQIENRQIIETNKLTAPLVVDWSIKDNLYFDRVWIYNGSVAIRGLKSGTWKRRRCILNLFSCLLVTHSKFLLFTMQSLTMCYWWGFIFHVIEFIIIDLIYGDNFCKLWEITLESVVYKYSIVSLRGCAFRLLFTLYI